MAAPAAPVVPGAPASPWTSALPLEPAAPSPDASASSAPAETARTADATTPCHCHFCDCEVAGVWSPDFELTCQHCKGTSCEILDVVASAPPARAAHQLLAGQPGAPVPASNLPEAMQGLQTVVSTMTMPMADNTDINTTAAAQMSAAVAALQADAVQRQVRRLEERRQRRRAQGRIDARAPEPREGMGVPRHFGVICDGCRSRDFAGVRHRCRTCPDFDLCASCYERRAGIHPGHDFEEIATPRNTLQSLVLGHDPSATGDSGASAGPPGPPGMASAFSAASNLARAGRTVFAIIELGLDGSLGGEEQSGLEDSQVAWWLADDSRLADAEQVAAQEPAWACPICAEGLEAEDTNGWVVHICGKKNAEEAGNADQSAKDSDCPVACDSLPTGLDGYHVYHEGCLRQWLVKKNSCPVCRRSPVIGPPEH